MHIHTDANPFIAPVGCPVLDLTTGGHGIVESLCEDGTPLILWAHTRKPVTPIVGRVYAQATFTYQEVVKLAPKIKEQKGQYLLYLGFYGYIPDALSPYLSNSEDNTNLRVIVCSYRELVEFTRKFSAYHFHVYVMTGEYSTDLGNCSNGGWAHFGDKSRRYMFPIYSSYVRYYDYF